MNRPLRKSCAVMLAALMLFETAIPALALEKKQFDISEVKDDAVAHKIHGDGYQCGSFEELNVDLQNMAVSMSKIASYVYQDGNGAYRDDDGNVVARNNAYAGTGYKPCSQVRIKELLGDNSGLSYDANGTIYNPKQPKQFNAVLLEDGNGNVVISYRGTEGPKSLDAVDDAKQAAVAGWVPQQYKDAAILLNTVLENAKGSVICDGHSLGGGLVAYAMAANDLEGRVTGYTFNTAGLAESTVESLNAGRVRDAAAHIQNYRNQSDPVSYVGYHLGPTYEVKTVADGNQHTIAGDHSDQYLTENLSAAAKKNAVSSDVMNASIETRVDVNDVFRDSPAEVKSAMDVAKGGYENGIENTIKDEGLANSVKDFVAGKIDEAIKKGEEWIENGGIRDAIKQGLDKILDGKVSDADKQHVMNLTDGLCNVNKDGGKSLVSALGSDGKELATDLAINELKKQISNGLPKDVADNLNGLVDSLRATGDINDPATKAQLVETIQAAVKEYVPYENSANAINKVIADIADGNGVDVIGGAQDLGKSIAADALKDVVDKNLDKDAAAKINALIDAYTQNGTQGLTEAALKEINAEIDKYAPGEQSAAALKDVLSKMADGTVTATDIKNAGTSTVADAAKKLIDKSGLSSEAKEAAKEAVDQLAKNGLNGLTVTAQQYIEQYVSSKLGDEAGAAAGAIFNAAVTPGVDVWVALEKNAPIIGKAVLGKCLEKAEKWAAAELDKLIAKCPALKKIFDKLGINGGSIVSGVKDIWTAISGKNLSEALTALSQLALDWFKGLAAKLIDWGVETLVGLANSLINRVLGWVSDLLGNIAGGVNWDVLKNAILKLQAQLDAARKSGSIKITVKGVGDKIVDWVEGKFKKSGEKTKQSGDIK